MQAVLSWIGNQRLRNAAATTKRQPGAAVAEFLDLHLSAEGITPPMPIDQLAMTLTGLASRLAVGELSDPGSVSDELLRDTLAPLVSRRAILTAERIWRRRSDAKSAHRQSAGVFAHRTVRI